MTTTLKSILKLEITIITRMEFIGAETLTGLFMNQQTLSLMRSTRAPNLRESLVYR